MRCVRVWQKQPSFLNFLSQQGQAQVPGHPRLFQAKEARTLISFSCHASSLDPVLVKRIPDSGV